MASQPSLAAMDNTCPHCHGSPCLPGWRKLSLGPVAHTRCRICGYKVGVEPLRALLVMLPLFLLTLSITAGALRDPVAAVMLLVILLLVCGALYLWWVPLSPREITDKRLVQAAKERIARERQGR